MINKLSKLILTGSLLGLSILNGIYNPKGILILSSLIGILIIKKIFDKKIKNPEILIINIYLLASLYLSTYANLGHREIIVLITAFSIISLKDFFLKHKKFIAKLLVFLCGIQLILSLHQVFNLDINRAYGFFIDSFNTKIFFPNAFALFNIISLGFISNLNNKTQKLLLILSFVNIYLSQSRGGLIAYFIILFAYLIHEFKNKLNKKNILENIILIILVCISVFGINKYLNKDKININFHGTSKLTSIDGRIDSFQYGLKQIIENPFVINGSNSFQEFSKKHQEKWLSNAPHPHNFLIKYWSELGIGFIILFSIFAINVIKNLNLKPGNPKFLESVGIISIIFHNSIDYNLNFPINIALFFILLSFNYKSINLKFLKKYKTQILSINAILIIIVSTSFLYKYQKYRNLRDNMNTNFEYQNFNFENSILLQLQKANNYKQTIAEENLNYFIENSYNLSLNNFELAKYYKDKDTNKSKRFILEAIRLNPRNNWDFYKFAVENKIETFRDIPKELDQYLYLAENNIHYTSNSNNMKTAIEVCKLSKHNICNKLEAAQEKFKK
ncbi:O-antigen ligase family protein [bacterium]|jgi:O-antigen ligase|nr:O-antigen ligase family protein [bacterium]